MWPQSWGSLNATDLKIALRRYIYGTTAAGDYGLPFQLKLLSDHGLKASFFVESLFAEGFGNAALAEIVGLIEDAGQEVQLHLHSEWVDKFPRPILRERSGMNIKDFSLREQTLLIEKALANLRACGCDQITAFRAGNYGADMNTLSALSANGISYDTSYNFSYLDRSCGLDALGTLTQPKTLATVTEVPITYYDQWGGRFRHVQLTACSYQELTYLMKQAQEAEYTAFVIVSHSFELLNRAKTRPDPLVVRRFEKLCRFLADNRLRYRTKEFNALKENELVTDAQAEPLQSTPPLTAWRYVEQATRRIYG